MIEPINYVRQTDFLEVSRFHLSHNKLWRKLNRLSSEKYGSLKACILRYHGYNGHQQVLWQAKSIAREVAGDCLLSAQQQIINQVQGDQTQLTEQNLTADSSQYQQQANQRLQLKGQRARLTPQKQLANYGKNKQQLTSKKITIRGQNQQLASSLCH